AKDIEVVAAEKSQNIPGVGISGNVDGTDYMIVNGNYLTKQGIRFDEAAADKWAAKGNSVSFLLQGTQVQGMVAEGDTIKAGAKE
ncbi:copper-translocating P-type ATPase, partial [Lactobacillus delbrueckii subsp. lactis]|nr:copper-translocating P-type ATPase [Lactobacillus delbrueckii subsp. lactis]